MSAVPELFPAEESPATIKIADQPIVVDRSTLEPYIDCPLAGRLKESLVKSVGIIAATGNEVHRSISEALVSYVDSHTQAGTSPIGPRELKDIIELQSWHSRPDVQPDAVKAIKYSLYSIARLIGDVNVESILAFDGGDDCHVPDLVTIGETTGDLNGTAEIVLDDEILDLKRGMLISGVGIPPGSVVTDIDGTKIAISRDATLAYRGIALTFSKRIMRSLSGQLDYDIQCGNQMVRLTAEMDFLHSTKSPGLLRLYDWKSGFFQNRESDVESSFQFQMYALLILLTYPDIEAVDVVILNTRINKATMPVRFMRSDVDRIKARVNNAVREYIRFRGLPLDKVEARPSREACRLCSAAALCSVCDEDIKTIKADPLCAVNKLYTLNRAIEEIESTLKIVCIERGDLVTKEGNAFGFGRVKRKVAAKAELFQTTPSDDEE